MWWEIWNVYLYAIVFLSWFSNLCSAPTRQIETNKEYGGAMADTPNEWPSAPT